MGDFNVTIPKLGESIQEGTITKLLVKEGEFVKEDDILFELATDKVDSEIPSPVSGKIKEIRCTENETYPVGEVIIIISMEDGEKNDKEDSTEDVDQTKNDFHSEESQFIPDVETSEKTSSNPLSEDQVPTSEVPGKKEEIQEDQSRITSSGKEIGQERFISPLVKSIAEKEGISQNELNSIPGSGLGGRIQRNDVIKFVEEKKTKSKENVAKEKIAPESKLLKKTFETEENKFEIPVNVGPDDTVIKMERIRKLIADHMILSKNVSAHVTSVVETDVTNLVLWRNKIKDLFLERYNEKITFLPMITEAVAKVLSEFKIVNSSVDGENIILKRHINIGIAVAKEDDTLIVPVIRDADTKNLLGLTKEINSFGKAAKNNKILPDQLQNGTFSITNFGSFKNIIGTPIINQPQVAILAVGLIEKKPSVLETPTGDAIVIRHKMFLSLSYDHRVIDGMLGGKFLRRIADILEQFDLKREF